MIGDGKISELDVDGSCSSSSGVRFLKYLLRSDCFSAIAAISYPASTKVKLDLMPDWSRTLIMQTLAKF